MSFALLCKVRFWSATLALSLLATSAWGFSIQDPDPDSNVADIVANPDRIYSFDGPTITWKMSTQFVNRFPLAKQQEQARLAIAEWEDGMFSAIRRAAPTYGWTRWSGASDFYDLRSILTHEIGHALGSQHPDAAWFNDSGDGTPFNLNFVMTGNGPVPAPPQGGEVMNEGNDASSLPNNKPPKGLGPGAIWRTLSQDELEFLDYAYPNSYDFVEVGPNDDAELVIDLFAVGEGPGNTLGIGFISSSEARNPNDPDAGRRITGARAKVREEMDLPIGFKALPRNWEIENNTGESINSVIITARGTNNPIPTTWSSSGAKKFQFQGALAPPPVPDPRAFDLEDVAHLYTNVDNGPVLNGESVDVGLRKDVWDWTVVDSQAIQTDGDFVDIGLVSIMGFGFVGPVTENDGELPDDIHNDESLWALHGTFDVLAKGIQIVNPEADTATVISSLSYVPAPELDPNLTAELNSDTLGRLSASVGALSVDLPQPITLGPGESHYFLLEGTPDGLPDEAFESGRWTPAPSIPGLMDGQLLVFADSQGGGFEVGNYALLNTPTYIPEPASLASALLALALMLVNRPKSA